MNATSLDVSSHELLNRLAQGTGPPPDINEGVYGIKPGGYVDQFERTSLLRSHPTCYPYGHGAPPRDVSLKHYFSWAMRYEDRRFSSDKFFYFDLFNIQQKREIFAQSRVTFLRKDWERVKGAMDCVTKADLESAVEEEKQGAPISNTAISDFLQSAVITRSKVVGSNASRARFWSDIWGTCVKYGAPSLFLTINPADHNDPIAQFLTGADIDLDNLVPILCELLFVC